VKQECLSQLILFGEGSLRRALQQFTAHYHAERNHQGKNNLLLFAAEEDNRTRVLPPIRCKERLGRLLRYYSTAAPIAIVWSNLLASAFHDARERLRTSTLMGISSDGKFETFSYCHGRRVFDVQDAPEHVRLRLGRSVNEKRSHR
jgi:hypothetical protein